MGSKELSVVDVLILIDNEAKDPTLTNRSWQAEFVPLLNIVQEDIALTYNVAPQTISVTKVSSDGHKVIYNLEYQGITFQVGLVVQSSNYRLTMKVLNPSIQSSWDITRPIAGFSDIKTNLKEMFIQWLLDNKTYIRNVRTEIQTTV